MQKVGKNSEGLSLGWGKSGQKASSCEVATICTDKKVSGLGVRGFYKLNKALLGK